MNTLINEWFSINGKSNYFMPFLYQTDYIWMCVFIADGFAYRFKI